MANEYSLKKLEEIDFRGHEVNKCSFEISKKPKPDESGYVTLQADTNLVSDENTPERMLCVANLLLRAFTGDSKKRSENDPVVFSISAQLILHYSLKRPKISLSKLNSLKWYFQSHAMIVFHIMVKDLLKDTPFCLLGAPPFRLK